MNHESKQADGRKPYEPPRLTTISLRPEEAVLGHCKISGGSGPGGPPGACGILCSTFGS